MSKSILDTRETKQLKDCEQIIERGMNTFVEVGRALATIREQRLYRATHKTFETYCKERWDFDRTYASRLIGAAKVVENIEATNGAHSRQASLENSNTVAHGQQNPEPTPLPKSERQARPLSELPPEEQGDAWLEAVTSAPDGQPTGKQVEEVVERRKQSEPPAPITDRRNQAITDPSIAAVFTDADRISRLMTACSVLKRDIREACEQPVGAWLKDQLQTCETLCDDLRHRIKISLPYALTPPGLPDGDGKFSATAKAKQLGWITEEQWKSLGKHMRGEAVR